MEKRQKHLNKCTAESIALLKVIDSICHLKDPFDVKCIHKIFIVILTYRGILKFLPEISAYCIIESLIQKNLTYLGKRNTNFIPGSMLHK